MNREEFLGQPDIHAFISWLSTDVCTRVFTLSIKPSRFVPEGLSVRVEGIEDLVSNYLWKSRWLDTRTNSYINSGNWETTKVSLKRLREWLKESVTNSDQSQALAASKAVLEWGGVRNAKLFVEELAKKGELTNYLKSVRDLLSTNRSPSQKISDIDATNILKFDSGLTKIHSFLDDSGSPIYDSRVAAAISLLQCLYKENSLKPIKPTISFPCGAARGKQVRNPRDFGYKRAKSLFTETSHHEWARTQLQLGWIIIELLRRNQKILESEGSLLGRAHAFEAGLFMAGYDLRCFNLPIR